MYFWKERGNFCRLLKCITILVWLLFDKEANSFPMHGGHKSINTLRLRQDGRLFPNDIFKCIFFNENVWILIEISLRFVPKAPISNIPALVQIMVWRQPGDKPLSGPMMVSLLTHICVTRPQWVKATINVRTWQQYGTCDNASWQYIEIWIIILLNKSDSTSRSSTNV